MQGYRHGVWSFRAQTPLSVHSRRARASASVQTRQAAQLVAASADRVRLTNGEPKLHFIFMTTTVTWVPARSRATRSGQRWNMHLRRRRCRSCRKGLREVVGTPGYAAQGKFGTAPRMAQALRSCCGGGGGSGSLHC